MSGKSVFVEYDFAIFIADKLITSDTHEAPIFDSAGFCRTILNVGHVHGGESLREIGHFTTVTSNIQRGIPNKILSLNRSTADGKFHTLIDYVTGVNGAENVTSSLGRTGAQNLVVRVVSIICIVQMQPILEETQLKAYFSRTSALRAKDGVTFAPIVTGRIDAEVISGRPKLRAGNVGVGVLTHLCPRRADLTKRENIVVQDASINQRLGEHEGSAHRRIEVATVLQRESGSPVISAGNGEEDGVLPICTELAEHTDETFLGGGVTELLIGINCIGVRHKRSGKHVSHLVVRVGLSVVRRHTQQKVQVEVTELLVHVGD